MKSKFGALALCVLTATQILCSVPASAATSHARTSISYNGKVVSQPFYITATDPSSHNPTSWLPLYYVQRTLNQVGVTSKWNGSTLSLTTGKGWTASLKNLPAYHKIAKGQMTFNINGKIVIYAPKIVSQDPYGHHETTYVPIYYLQQALTRLGITTQWTGSNFNLKH